MIAEPADATRVTFHHGKLDDVLLLVIAATLVMTMQGGFCLFASSLARAKNSINVGITILLGVCVSGLAFWSVGFAFMFGASESGLIGTTGFLLAGTAMPWKWAFFFFQMAVCGITATVVCGAAAERMRFPIYLLAVCVISGLVYPVFGHWAWGGLLPESDAGWLARRGLIDFAGSSVVHSSAGWLALAALLVIGPRQGRFESGPTPFLGQRLPMAAFGVFLLWFGWFGFNGGRALGASGEIPTILVNTNLSAAAGGVGAALVSWVLLGRANMTQVLCGVVAGLVGVTAGCRVLTPAAASLVGAVAGAICVAASQYLSRLRIDDVIGAVSAHGCAGAWGTLAVALVGSPDQWGTGLDRGAQLAVQASGVATCFIWSFGVGLVSFWSINRLLSLRVASDAERIGLNTMEHGVSTEVLDLIQRMEGHRRYANDRTPAHVDPNTEVGAIAAQYNRVIASFSAEEEQVRFLTAELVDAHRLMTSILKSAG